MVKLSREIVHKLRNQGKTYADIGRIFNVTRQYAHSLYTGYYEFYRKTDKYKMMRRHKKNHFIGSHPSKPCDYCNKSMSISSKGLSEYVS